MKDQLFVRAGERIRASVWNLLVRVIRSQRLIAGRNVRLERKPSGTKVHFVGGGSAVTHPFQCALAGDTAVRILPGTIGGLPPLVKPEEPLDQPRVFEWGETRLDDNGRGYIALEVTFGECWEITAAKLVQVASLDTLDGRAGPIDPRRPLGFRLGAPITLSDPALGTAKVPDRRARHPIAILWRDPATRALRLYQFTRHHLNQRAYVQSYDSKIARHFFYAVP